MTQICTLESPYFSPRSRARRESVQFAAVPDLGACVPTLGALKFQFKTQNPYNGELGQFTLPVATFDYNLQNIRKTNPELYGDLQQAAAIVYFGMLAATPQITADYPARYLPYDESTNWSAAGELGSMLEKERFLALPTSQRKTIVDLTRYSGLSKSAIVEPAYSAYLKQVKKLQIYLAKNGLWDGVQKTLNEQSRTLQSELAKAAASAQYKAYRAAMLAKAANVAVEEERIKAAQNVAKANKEYEEAIAAEEKLRKQLQNIENGLPADFGESSGGGLLLLAVLGVGAFLLFRGGKK